MPVEEVIMRLKGIKCGDKNTSCPDQLARALETTQNNILTLSIKFVIFKFNNILQMR